MHGFIKDFTRRPNHPESLVQFIKGTLGLKHASTLRAMCDLANNLFITGHYQQAERLASEHLDLVMQMALATDQNALCSRSIIAKALVFMGRHDESLAYHMEII